MSKVGSYRDLDGISAASWNYLRKVYAWLLLGVLIACASGYASVSIGTPEIYVDGNEKLLVPPIVAEVLRNQWTLFFLLIGLVATVGVIRKVRALRLIAFLLLTSVMGFFTGPAIFVAQVKVLTNGTMTTSPVRDAFVLTIVAFTGLSSYVFISRKDFSFLGATLWTGLWVVLAAMVLAIFLGASAFHLAVSSVAILLFSGYILFDTSNILHSETRDDALGDALNLFLDVTNIFVNLLSIFSSKSND
jgi:modulator of FtsH protease